MWTPGISNATIWKTSKAYLRDYHICLKKKWYSNYTLEVTCCILPQWGILSHVVALMQGFLFFVFVEEGGNSPVYYLQFGWTAFNTVGIVALNQLFWSGINSTFILAFHTQLLSAVTKSLWTARSNYISHDTWLSTWVSESSLQRKD